MRRGLTGTLRWVFPFPFCMFMDYFVLTLLRQVWNIIIIHPTHPMRTMFQKFQLHLTDRDTLLRTERLQCKGGKSYTPRMTAANDCTGHFVLALHQPPPFEAWGFIKLQY